MISDGYIYDDGGRESAGFKGQAGNCVTRAIAIASGLPYRNVYIALRDALRSRKRRRKTEHSTSPRDGVPRRIFHPCLLKLGFEWVPTMQIGSGCKVHLTANELPAGRLVVRVSKHVCAMIDGVIYDTSDPRRNNDRCVYGYYIKR